MPLPPSGAKRFWSAAALAAALLHLPLRRAFAPRKRHLKVHALQKRFAPPLRRAYLLNRTLFDRYFFSTVPRSGSTDNGFANPLIRPDRAGHPPERLRDFEQAAAHLRLHGAFNINSTSVEAWTALLASFRGQALPGTDAVGDLSPFPRALFPLEDPLVNAGSGNLTFQANRFLQQQQSPGAPHCPSGAARHPPARH